MFTNKVIIQLVDQDFPWVFSWEGPTDAKIYDAKNNTPNNIYFCESEGLAKKIRLFHFLVSSALYAHIKFVV